VALIEMAKVIIFLVLGYSSHVTPLVFSFSNQNEPNLAQTFRMIRIGSVRDCSLAILSLTEMNRTLPKPFG
jgi:hypothetical protein